MFVYLPGFLHRAMELLLLAQVLPFLLLGLGVDDMFVMAETFPSLDTVTDPATLTGTVRGRAVAVDVRNR